MEASRSSETPAINYQWKCRHIPEDPSLFSSCFRPKFPILLTLQKRTTQPRYLKISEFNYAFSFSSFTHSFFILFDFSCTLLPLFPLAFFHSACFFSCLFLPTSHLSCYLYFFPYVNLSLFSSDLLFSFDAVDSVNLICSGRHYKELSRWR